MESLLIQAGAIAPVAVRDEAAAGFATGPRPDEMPTGMTNC
jgi:hypothetical protein